MSEAQEAADSGASTDATTQIARDVADLVNAWTEASAEAWVGTSRILSNLAVDLVDTGYGKPINRAIRETADVMRRSSDLLAKASKPEGGEEKT